MPCSGVGAAQRAQHQRLAPPPKARGSGGASDRGGGSDGNGNRYGAQRCVSTYDASQITDRTRLAVRALRMRAYTQICDTMRPSVTWRLQLVQAALGRAAHERLLGGRLVVYRLLLLGVKDGLAPIAAVAVGAVSVPGRGRNLGDLGVFVIVVLL